MGVSATREWLTEGNFSTGPVGTNGPEALCFKTGFSFLPFPASSRIAFPPVNAA